jgi:hypothetical protein
MKKGILAGAAAFGLTVLVAGVGPAFAEGGGGIAPQEHWILQPEEAVETGALPPSDAGKQAKETVVFPSAQAGVNPYTIKVDPRWKDSGGQ